VNKPADALANSNFPAELPAHAPDGNIECRFFQLRVRNPTDIVVSCA
jgi:hypothetical protein